MSKPLDGHKLSEQPEAERLSPTPEQLLHELSLHKAELQRARRRYQALFEEAPVAYFILDQQRIVLGANESGLDLLDCDRAYLHRRSFIVFLKHTGHRTFFEHIRQAVASEHSVECELEIRSKQGRIVWGQLASTRFIDDDGSVRCMTAVVDATECKHLEDSLIEARDRAEAADRSESSFPANISHEIRTPMNAVLGLTELALGTGLDERQRRGRQREGTAERDLAGFRGRGVRGVEHGHRYSVSARGSHLREFHPGDHELHQAVPGYRTRARHFQANRRGLGRYYLSG